MKKEPGFYGTSKTAEHYTERFWWEKVIQVMEAIDIDPSSDPGMHIPAAVHYTKKDNGLMKPWGGPGIPGKGRVYNNPVFGRKVIEWFLKLWREMEAGRCTEAIILWKAALETEACEALISNPYYRCSAVPKNRIGFETGESTDPCLQKKLFGEDIPLPVEEDVEIEEGGDRNTDSSTFTPMFYYFGPNEDRFIRIFGKDCYIWKVIKTDTARQDLAAFLGESP